MPFLAFRRGSFAVHIGGSFEVRDHLGNISGLGIICGRGSFAALYMIYIIESNVQNYTKKNSKKPL